MFKGGHSLQAASMLILLACACFLLPLMTSSSKRPLGMLGGSMGRLVTFTRSARVHHPDQLGSIIQISSGTKMSYLECGPLTGCQWPPRLWPIFNRESRRKPSFTTVTVRGPHPSHTMSAGILSFTTLKIWHKAMVFYDKRQAYQVHMASMSTT